MYVTSLLSCTISIAVVNNNNTTTTTTTTTTNNNNNKRIILLFLTLGKYMICQIFLYMKTDQDELVYYNVD